MNLPRITGKEVERALLRAGWYLHHSRGSHFFYKHLDFPGKRVTLPMHVGETLAPKTLEGILKQAGLSVEEFMKLL
ncbi:MAG: type II toxin-antitoxin system HicA family toxin [Dehalococcoidia bacterium]|nr:type II toxin-antitoxin system HicA family toxin [Dehalococcoidia bacterium]